ncbi:hypothetical protein Q9Q99_10685 [Curtobacterium flaccumfaciens]|nr:hypothetical protein Q9Q99_10685 [Curtobacterium flaccumfaciens]
MPRSPRPRRPHPSPTRRSTRPPVAETTPAQEARPAPAVPVTSIADGPTAGGRASSEARRRWFQRPAVMLTAAAAVAAVFFGGTRRRIGLRPERLRTGHHAGLERP